MFHNIFCTRLIWMIRENFNLKYSSNINIWIKYLKNLKIFLWKKRRFRLRWDMSPGSTACWQSPTVPCSTKFDTNRRIVLSDGAFWPRYFHVEYGYKQVKYLFCRFHEFYCYFTVGLRCSEGPFTGWINNFLYL